MSKIFTLFPLWAIVHLHKMLLILFVCDIIYMSLGLSLSLPGHRDYMCPTSSVYIITDYMWLLNTHRHVYLYNPDIIFWHVVKVSIFQLFIWWLTLRQINRENLITLIIYVFVCMCFSVHPKSTICCVRSVLGEMLYSDGTSVCIGMHAQV